MSQCPPSWVMIQVFVKVEGVQVWKCLNPLSLAMLGVKCW
jgi:hypothetical protein